MYNTFEQWCRSSFYETMYSLFYGRIGSTSTRATKNEKFIVKKRRKFLFPPFFIIIVYRRQKIVVLFFRSLWKPVFVFHVGRNQCRAQCSGSNRFCRKEKTLATFVPQTSGFANITKSCQKKQLQKENTKSIWRADSIDHFDTSFTCFIIGPRPRKYELDEGGLMRFPTYSGSIVSWAY